MPTQTHQDFLTPEQVEQVLSSPETFAEYLVTLSPEQVREYKAQVQKSDMNKAENKALLALLDLTEQEATKNLEEYRQTVGPEIERVSLCLSLGQQIDELEKLAATL